MNIAELLKDCPKGTKLYSPIFGEVELEKVYRTSIVVKNKNGMLPDFYSDGKYHSNGECMLFPSKENRDWSTFQRPFKDGDILAYQFGGFTNPSIYIHKYVQNLNTSFYVALSGNGDFKVRDKYREALHGDDSSVRLATEKEKQKLFDAIKENGYRWNAETKTLEKLVVPKFKVGDRIKQKKDYISGIITDIGDGTYKVEYKSGGVAYANIEFQDDWELVPNKFDITTLRPFDKVLVRDNYQNHWAPNLYSHYMAESKDYHFATAFGNYRQCIPYENNQHLLGTTNNCDEYYKTWE